MAMPLLRTKLYIPPVRPELVPRPRLIERLNTGLHRKLTLISAPAGFGKTTLLSEWVAGCGRPVAWVSLDEGDSDPARFWSYFIAALQTIPSLSEAAVGESALAALQTPQSPPIKALLTGLINEIAELPNPFALILDDFHLITEQQVHDALTFTLDNLPPRMHLILSSRADPPWPLARLRARREMTELRANDLRFTPEEAAAFVNDAMQLDLSPEDVAALEARTEGWIAGLQMAAISMREQRRTQGMYDLSGFIKAFAGSHRFVLDYLVEEVLNQQSPTVQEFLLKTSILERMTAPLCDAVTEGADSQTILTQLERANLFLVPLDDERRWYRYHHLFAGLLRSRLEQTQPDQVPALHRQASEWYEKNGLIAEAASHVLAAGDAEEVARLVEGHAFDMLDLGELTTLVGWLDALPDEVVRSRPWLCVAQAWVQVYTGRLDAVEPHLQDAEQALSRSDAWQSKADSPVLSPLSLGQRTRGPSAGLGTDSVEGPVLSAVEGRHITGHITSIRAYIAELRGDMPHAAELARKALEFLPEDDLKTRAFVAAMLGTVLHIRGDLEAAAQAFSGAVTISQQAGDSHMAVHVLCDLAALQRDKGQLHKAAATCRQALQLANEYSRFGGRWMPGIDYAHARLSEVLCQWNDLDAALRHVREGLELAKRRGEADKLWICYTRLAIVLSCTGDLDGAFEALEKARQTEGGKSYHVAFTDIYEVAMRLKQGDIAAVSLWVQESGLSADDEIILGLRDKYILLARILIAQGELDDALRLLVRLLEMAESAGLVGYVIRILVLQAVALKVQGEIEQALAALERALFLAEPEGYVRTFIDEGLPMGELLRKAAARGIAVDYVGKLLAALESETKDERRTTEPSSSLVVGLSSPLVEPLSERELEVLRLLTTHLSSTEMAEELFVSANTIRFHIKNIYSKLNVHRRSDAIQRAKELELL